MNNSQIYQRLYMRKWRKLNPDKVRTSGRISDLKRRDKRRAYQLAYNRKWRIKNREKIYASNKKYIANNMNARISQKLRTRLYQAVMAQLGFKRGHLKDLIGTSIPQLRQHLESQFQPGMSWNNYGQWHIDHVIALANFDLTKLSEQKKSMHYTNLQPLLAKDNLSKGAKIML